MWVQVSAVDSPWLILGFFSYFGLLIAIAVAGARRMRDMSDYVLGGRRLSSFTAALSAGSSTTSAWTMLALPALAFSDGAVSMWVPVAASIGILLSWTVVARRLRRYTIEANNVLTIPEFYEARFGDKTGVLRTLASIITIFFVVFYVSSGLVGGSKLLETIFGIEAVTGVLLTFFAVASYTLIGGFMAVSRTDVFQALLMLASLTLIVLTVFRFTEGEFTNVGGLGGNFLNPFTDHGGDPITIVFLLSVTGWAFGAFGAQRILQRFMAIEREDKIVQSRNISVVWVVTVYALAITIGLLAHTSLAHSESTPVLEDAERIYLIVSEVFFHPVVTGVLLTAVIAAVMSTADSQLLLASAVATDDTPFIKRIADRVSANAKVWLGRLLLVIIGWVAVAISIFWPESIFDLVSFAWGGMGAAFGPVTILSLYWRRFNAWGAIASIVVGTLIASLWWLAAGGPDGIWDIQPATPGFFVATIAAVVVSKITPKPSEEVLNLFDRVNSNEGKLSGNPLSGS